MNGGGVQHLSGFSSQGVEDDTVLHAYKIVQSKARREDIMPV